MCVKKMKKQEKQHVGRPLSNNCVNFIQNGKYCYCHMGSLSSGSRDNITCYHFCFIQKTLNGEIDTACPSNKTQTQQLPLSPWLACKLTRGVALWWQSLSGHGHHIHDEPEALGLFRSQEKSGKQKYFCKTEILKTWSPLMKISRFQQP